jgi:formate dehydrogenase subunit gamma
MRVQTSRKILRYEKPRRVVHWIGAITFLMLLFTGVLLLASPLAFLAAGGWSRLLHRIGAMLFVGLPFVYAMLNPGTVKELLIESFTYGRADWEWFKHMPAYFFGRTKNLPPQGRVNAGQKLHHTVTFLSFVVVAGSGYVLWFGKSSLGANALAYTAMVHDLSMLALTVMLIGHLYFTFLYDALPGMLTGYVSEEYARMEHPKWLESLPENEFIVRAEEVDRAEKQVEEIKS